MIVRNEQMQVFEKAAQVDFEAEMLAHLKETYPGRMAGVDDDRIRRLISRGIEQARGYGFEARGPVRMYLDFMVTLGHEFDRDPLLFWIRDILCDRDGLHEMTQAGRLHSHVGRYLDLVYGLDDRWIEGLEHIVKALPENLAAVGRTFGANAVRWLAALHPRKSAYAGNAALANLVQEARRTAELQSLPEPEGPPLALLLMFYCGSGVMTDPSYPWVADSLAPESGDPPARLEALIASTSAYLCRVLEETSEE